jgi:hypothetical protein
MSKFTHDQLKAMLPAQRIKLYENASRLARTPDGAATKLQIEQSGLLYQWDSALTMDDPTTIKMMDVIFSEEGRKAALASTERGEPALADIDPILQSVLGAEYRSKNYATVTAGKLVGILMRQLGYVNAGKKGMPPECVAQTAETWRLRSAES